MAGRHAQQARTNAGAPQAGQRRGAARLLARSERSATKRVRRRIRRAHPHRRGRLAPARRCGRKRRTCYRAGCRLRARNGPQAATATGRAPRPAKARRAATAGAPRARGAHGPEPTVPWCRRAPRRMPMAGRQARQARTYAGAHHAAQQARLQRSDWRQATHPKRRGAKATSRLTVAGRATAQRLGPTPHACHSAGGRAHARSTPQAAATRER